MFGVAIRIAYRMGIHSELACAKQPPFEVEVRRRLWWSLKLLDARISELADYRTVALEPTWDCRIPLNVNDSDLRPEITEPPPAQGTFSEALFVVVRSEVGEFVRHSRVRLGFASLPVANDVLQTEGSKLDALEKNIEDKYLRFCNPENPLHYMTIWTTRTYFAKNRLLEHYLRWPNSSTDLTDTKRDVALCHAIKLLSSDTRIMTSPLTKGYLWLTRFYFPLPAYMHILQDLRRRPICKYAEGAWKAMSENFESRVIAPLGQGGDSPFLNIFFKIVLPAWEAREAILGTLGDLSIPKIVLFIRERMARKAYNVRPANREQEQSVADMSMNDLPMSIPMGLGDYDLGFLYGAGGQDIYAGTSFGILGHQLDWATMDWGFGGLLT